MTPDTPRERWMDVIRGLAILLVIVLHSATILPAVHIVPEAWLLDTNRVFILFRMPTLAFLSGLLLPRALAKPPAAFVRGKLKRIAWPLLVWTGIHMLVLDIDPAPGVIVCLLKGGSYLWFLTFILLYYLSAIALRHVPGLLVAAMLFTLAVAAPDGAKYSERLLYLGALFYLGAWVGDHWQAWMTIVRSRWAPAALIPAGYFSAAMMRSPQVNYGPADLVAACCFIVGIAAVACSAQHLRGFRPIGFVGRNSLPFYVMHWPVIYLWATVCKNLGVTGSAVISLTSIVVALCLSTLTVIGTARVPLLRLLFVGPHLPSVRHHRLSAARPGGG